MPTLLILQPAEAAEAETRDFREKRKYRIKPKKFENDFRSIPLFPSLPRSLKPNKINAF